MKVLKRKDDLTYQTLSDCKKVRITINDTEFDISEYHGQLCINLIDGKMAVYPHVSNVVHISAEV